MKLNKIKNQSELSFKQRGQVVVEYVLLLAISVVIAVSITSLAVSRDKDSPGFLIAKWRNLLNFIADDHPDEY